MQNNCFSISFSILFENILFRIKLIIMRGLGAILVSPAPTTGLGVIAFLAGLRSWTHLKFIFFFEFGGQFIDKLRVCAGPCWL